MSTNPPRDVIEQETAIAAAIGSVRAAEEYLAGAAVLGPEALDDVRANVRVEDFAHDHFRTVVAAACELRDAGRPVEVTSVFTHLRATGRLAHLGERAAEFLADIATLHDLRDGAQTGTETAYYASVVRGAALRRHLAAIGTELVRDALNPVEDAEDLAHRFAKKIADAAEGRARGNEPAPIADVIRRAITRYDNASSSAQRAGVSTGFASLDQLLGGFEPGQLVIMAARPSVGKSALALRMAERVAGARVGVLVFSLEMSETENADRLLASVARVPLRQLRGAAAITDENAARAVVQCEKSGLAGLPLYLDDQPTRTAASIAVTARRFARRRGVRLVVVDYLQLVKPENPRDARYLQVGQDTKTLKRLAREAGVAVLCLAQLNREVEGRGGGRPRLSDLRDSGEIEQDADVVLLLHQLQTDEHLSFHRVDLIVAKNRNGPRGTVGLLYERAITRFDEHRPES